MEETTPHTLHVDSIRSDLNRIVDEWLHLHFRLAAVLVAIAFLVESCMAFFIVNSEILTTTITRYIIKYIVLPTCLSVLCLLAAHLTIRAKHITHQTKIYTMSLIFVLICTIYYTAHGAFVSIYALYAFAIFLTTTYANFKLTGLTSIISLGSLIVSELFFYWDSDKISVFADPNRLVDFLVALSILAGCSIVCSITIQYEQRKNEASLRREVERELLKESMLFDELTGAYNRKALHNELRLLEQATPSNPLVFGIADIDHFKSVNDLYGHQVGDLCLVEFACVLCEYFGESSVFRYGGDEFCLILKNTTIDKALLLCERAQARLRRVEFDGLPELKPTACFGLTEYVESDDIPHFFNQADEALYEAKKVRNAIRVYHLPSGTPGNFRVLPPDVRS